MNRKHLLDPTLTAVVFFLAAWVVLAAMTLATLTPLGSPVLGTVPAVQADGLAAGPGPRAADRW